MSLRSISPGFLKFLYLICQDLTGFVFFPEFAFQTVHLIGLFSWVNFCWRVDRSVTWFWRRWRHAIVVLCSGFCCFWPLRSTVCCPDGFPLFLFRNKSSIWISNVRRRRCIWHWFCSRIFRGNLPFGDWNFRSLWCRFLCNWKQRENVLRKYASQLQESQLWVVGAKI